MQESNGLNRDAGSRDAANTLYSECRPAAAAAAADRDDHRGRPIGILKGQRMVTDPRPEEARPDRLPRRFHWHPARSARVDRNVMQQGSVMVYMYLFSARVGCMNS